MPVYGAIRRAIGMSSAVWSRASFTFCRRGIKLLSQMALAGRGRCT
jgi:hypothetical protein